MVDNVDFLPVLLGSDINVYGIARSFHEAYRISSVAVGKGRLRATANSRIVTVEVAEPNIEDDEVFVKTLRDFAGRYPKDLPLLLVPCGDNYTRLLARNVNKLRDVYKFETISEELLERVTTKDAFYKLCDEHGLLYPKTGIATVDSRAPEAFGLQFPVVVKPADSVAYWNSEFPHKKKVFVAYNREEYDEILEAIYTSSYKEPLIIQEYIPGEDSKMRVMNCYCGGDGKVRLLCLAQALLEEHSPDGIGSYAALIPVRDDELSEKIRNFLEAIGYKGFANFDIKLDERDGKYKIFEINPRQGRSSFVVTAAGSNLARELADDLIFDKRKDFFVEDRKVLWTCIPDKIIFDYVKDETLKTEARELIKSGKRIQSLYYKPDMSIKRRLYFSANQRSYFGKYGRYFGNKSLKD